MYFFFNMRKILNLREHGLSVKGSTNESRLLEFDQWVNRTELYNDKTAVLDLKSPAFATFLFYINTAVHIIFENNNYMFKSTLIIFSLVLSSSWKSVTLRSRKLHSK